MQQTDSGSWTTCTCGQLLHAAFFYNPQTGLHWDMSDFRVKGEILWRGFIVNHTAAVGSELTLYGIC